MADGQYTKTTWVNGAAPALSAANLNNLETQHEEVAYMVCARIQPPIVRWVMPGWSHYSQSAVAVTANRIYYEPIYVPEAVSYDRIGIYVAVGDGAGGLADLRIFQWESGVPTNLILSCGTVSTNAVGAKEAVIAQSLGPGLYFLAIRCDQTPTLAGILTTACHSCPVASIETSNDQFGPNHPIMYDDAAYSDPAGAVDGVLDVDCAFVRLREA